MDSVSRLVADLTSWHWWLTIVCFGVAINVASAYLKLPLDRILSKYSKSRRDKSDARLLELTDQVNKLVQDSNLLLLEAMAELREMVFTLFLVIFGFVFAGLAIFAVTLIREKTFLEVGTVIVVLFIGMLCHALAMTTFSRAAKRAKTISIALTARSEQDAKVLESIQKDAHG